MKRKTMKLFGRPDSVLKRRTYATFQAISNMHRRHKVKFVEETTLLHYPAQSSRFNDNRWAHNVAVSLFDEGKINDIKSYQEKLLNDIAPWKDTRIHQIYLEARELRDNIIHMIDSAELSNMNEDQLQELIHGYNGLVDEIPFIDVSECCRHRNQ